ncbi:unnamed protein product [Blepharisma stoltei]|uniref:EF-hand domain-containing protein n=1 Tax=Blepharisma stoltei TaxID=1481888 RepID=A0AAU9J1S4_9CILI|nr:unnamed protein product [Blepharisma stoltei]
MLCQESKKLLGEFLLAIADKESESEKLKESLEITKYIDPEELFLRLDSIGYGYLRPSDILHICSLLQIATSEGECKGLLRFFDYDSDSRLGFLEFLDIILPRNNDSRAYLLEKIEKSIIFNSEVDFKLKKILEHEIGIVKMIERYKRQLEKFDGFNVIRAYGEIKKSHNDLADLAIVEFFQSIGIEISLKDVENIISRIDKDKDGKIGYSEFVGMFSNFHEKTNNDRSITPIRSTKIITPLKPIYADRSPISELRGLGTNRSQISELRSLGTNRSNSRTPLKNKASLENSRLEYSNIPLRKSAVLNRSNSKTPLKTRTAIENSRFEYSNIPLRKSAVLYRNI